MQQDGKIKVLIVDDSVIFREMLARGISADPMLEVVGKAVDAYDARDKILELEPDVMTCDIEMPKMNGIEFVRRLLPQYPLPVIMVSTISNVVFEAMRAGAVDFVVKPSGSSWHREFFDDLNAKIKAASRARVMVHPLPRAGKPENVGSGYSDKIRLIAIGASTGGTEAIYNVLRLLPPDVPGIAIVQHIPPVFSRMFAERLNNQTALEVKEAETGDYIERGRVFVAPGNMHITVHKLGDRYKIECAQGEKVNGHCPSADVLFDSVAKADAAHSLGVILTGMGSDGARGLLAMRRGGAYTIGQDESSCVVYGMPRVAYELGAVVRQAPLNQIPNAILQALKE